MLLAELEFFHSRRIAPTRRIALGHSNLPCDPAPGFGGILLGAVVASNVGALDDELLPELSRLALEVEEGQRIPQPKLRYRLQTDRVGLLRTRLRLVRRNHDLSLDVDLDRSTPAQRVLAAIYTAGTLPPVPRRATFGAIRRGIGWEGPIGPGLFAALSGTGGRTSLSTAAFGDPIGWALDMLGFEALCEPRDDRDGLAAPARTEIQRRYRVLLRQAHPDHGGDATDAARRIADLREARRLLMS